MDIQMKRTITIIVRRLNIILSLDDLNVCLSFQHFRHPVHIIDVAAHNARTGNIVYVPPRHLQGRRKSFLHELRRNAFGRFDAALNMMNGISRIVNLEIIVQNLKLQSQLLDGRIIEISHQEDIMGVIPKYGAFFCLYYLFILHLLFHSFPDTLGKALLPRFDAD